MIKGLGIDICDTKKIALMAKKSAFMKRVFAPAEAAYCMSKRNFGEHLAGRFAVKEAFIKALSTDKGIALNVIETRNNKDGKPEIVLTPAVRKALKKKGAKKAIISISHTKTAAAAVCILV